MTGPPAVPTDRGTDQRADQATTALGHGAGLPALPRLRRTSPPESADSGRPVAEVGRAVFA